MTGVLRERDEGDARDDEDGAPSRARRSRAGRDESGFRPKSPLRRMAETLEETPASERPLPFPPARRPWAWWAAGAALAILAGFAMAERTRAMRAETRWRELRAKAPVPATASADRPWADLLQARDLRISVLAPPPPPAPAPRRGAKVSRPAVPAPPAFPGAAEVFWDPARREGLLRATGLPPAPAGQEYVLWIKQEGKADAYVAAGGFPLPADPRGVVLHRFGAGPESRIAGFEISLERADATVAPVTPGAQGHPRGRTVLRATPGGT